jgi:hypothetical protein
VLPIERKGITYQLLDAVEARKRGFTDLADWLRKSEKIWNERRGSKAESMTIYERIDRVHGLTRQDPKARFWVIYNKSGTFLTAAKVEKDSIEFSANGQKIIAAGFLADHVTYYFEASDLKEANYLTSILNAPKVDELVTPMQTRGQWGPRDIHKKVLELPIPQFDVENPVHLHLAKLADQCEKKVNDWLDRGAYGQVKSIGRLRQMVRQMLKDELAEIDGLVQQILE